VTQQRLFTEPICDCPESCEWTCRGECGCQYCYGDKMTDTEFVEDMRTLREEHEADGYPCVQTWQIDRLIAIIEGLTAERDLFRKEMLALIQEVGYDG